MATVRVGVVGAGRMGKNHCRVISTLRLAVLAGVCDQEARVGEAVARQYEAPYFARLDDLLDRVDAVCVATPTPGHFATAMRALERGLAVFIEKPITETVAEADALVEMAERSQRVVQVGHIERFNPAYAELKNVLAEMTPLAVNFRRLSPYAGSNTDVDVVLDLMIHDLDLLGDLTGAVPATVEAAGITAHSGSLDHVIACLRAEAGPLVTVTASRLTEQKVRQIEVTTLEAYVVADLLNKSIAVHRSMVGEYVNQAVRGVKYRQESVVESIHVPMAEPLFLELQHFLESVRTGSKPLVTAADGARALRLAMQVRTTAQANLLSVPLQQPIRALHSA